jgi:hypothetical protein
MVILQYSLLSLCIKLYNSSIVKNAKMNIVQNCTKMHGEYNVKSLEVEFKCICHISTS